MSGQSIPVPGTPLPWQYRDDYTTEGFVTIIGNVDGEYVDGVAHCTYDVVCRCEDEFGERLPNVAKNVRYIVHACNEYPALKAHADAMEAALAERDRYAAECPLDQPIVSKADRDQCSVCGATAGESCGRKVTADYRFVESARATLTAYRSAGK